MQLFISVYFVYWDLRLSLLSLTRGIIGNNQNHKMDPPDYKHKQFQFGYLELGEFKFGANTHTQLKFF